MYNPGNIRSQQSDVSFQRYTIYETLVSPTCGVEFVPFHQPRTPLFHRPGTLPCSPRILETFFASRPPEPSDKVFLSLSVSSSALNFPASSHTRRGVRPVYDSVFLAMAPHTISSIYIYAQGHIIETTRQLLASASKRAIRPFHVFPRRSLPPLTMVDKTPFSF